MQRLAWFFAASLVVSASQAEGLTIATFNTESDSDTVPANVAETIGALGPFDILAVQEVESTQALRTYTDAAAAANGGRWRYIVSESGVYGGNRKPDLLGIIYSTDTFRQIQTTEYHAIRSRPDGTEYGVPDWGLRGALILRLQHIQSGTEFQVVTVHLKCCNEPAIRAHQTALLAEHIMSADVPTVLLGDTNVPIEPGDSGATGANVEAFENLTTAAGLKWIAPTNPVKTQCSPLYNSMLDQVFGPASLIAEAFAEVRFPEATYCDLDALGYSDHRPVVATFPMMFAAGEIFPLNADEVGDPDAVAEEREFILQQAVRPEEFLAP